MLLTACSEQQPSTAIEGCSSGHWQRLEQLSLLALETTPVAKRRLEVFLNRSEGAQQGCAIGRLVTILWKLLWLPDSQRSWYLQEFSGELFGMLPMMPSPTWPVYQLMLKVQTRMRKDRVNRHSPFSCDLRGLHGMAVLRKELSLGMLNGSGLHPALVLLDMNESQICPLARATAFWALAAAQHGGGPCMSTRVLRLMQTGRMIAKHWWATRRAFHELFTDWPLWDFMAQLEEGLRLPPTSKSHRILTCPYGSRRVLTVGLEDHRVEAVVVFGRPSRLKILHRYLWRNLRINGGVLDHVMFVVLRAELSAQDFLRQFVSKHAPYYSIPPVKGKRFAKIYSVCNRPDTIYIKIDDDIVYISDAAIPSLIREKQRRRCSLVSANVINHAILSSVHEEIGAVRNFVPPKLNLQRKSNFTSEQSLKPATHWRRADEEKPMYHIRRAPQADCVWASWECAAWMHESFLSRLADGTSCAYDFGWFGFHSEGFEFYSKSKKRFLPLHTSRWSINFFAFTSQNLEAADWDKLATDDEAELSYKVPSRIGTQACAVGRAIVSHFSYWKQDPLLAVQTDLLHRYDVLSDALTQEPLTI